MTEANSSDSKKLGVAGRRTLQLKKTVDTGQVRQSFSHGRSKSVVVERKRTKRVPRPGKPGETEVVEHEEAALRAPAAEAQPAEAEQPEAGSEESRARGRVVLRTLTEDEKKGRAKALDEAREVARAAREHEQAEAGRRKVELERQAAEAAAAAKRRLEEEARKREEDESRRRAEEAAKRRLEPEAEAAPKSTAERAPAGEEEDEAARRGRSRAGERAGAGRREEPKRRTGKLTVVSAFEQDEIRQRSIASMRRQRARERRQHVAAAELPGKVIREVTIPDVITVQELAGRMAERVRDVIKSLMQMGVMATANQTIDSDTAELIVSEFGHRVKRVSESDVEIGIEGEQDREQDLESRAPVVTVMGHVDHGKTSLLDAIRQTNVTAREAGGITQHIGAYTIETAAGHKITFIDTPGHEAFTAMRSRGAAVTDLVILVVAADDGIMPQTVEAINHARAAGVPIIVAINKMDRPDADPARVRQGLLQHEVVCEEMGGDVLSVEVSATEKTNLDKLEEAIILQSELMELKANPNRAGEGVVIEARLDRGRGPVATVLIKRGTLEVGDVFVAGPEWGRVRALLDDKGERVEKAGPSVPVEVLGLTGAPQAGDDFRVVDTEARARDICEFRQRQSRRAAISAAQRVSLEQMMESLGKDTAQEVPAVIKADVQGSAEAIAASLDKLATEEVKALILHAGVGAVTESDVNLAQASKAVIIAFNVRANAQARDLAEQEGVEIRYYTVIYEIVDDMKKALSGLLAPARKETMLGRAEVREVFAVSKAGKVAGCLVTEGAVRRGAQVRLLRDDTVVHEGGISSLRRFKDEVREVNAGTECGIAIENYQDIRTGDVIEAFEVEEVARAL